MNKNCVQGKFPKVQNDYETGEFNQIQLHSTKLVQKHDYAIQCKLTHAVNSIQTDCFDAKIWNNYLPFIKHPFTLNSSKVFEFYKRQEIKNYEWFFEKFVFSLMCTWGTQLSAVVRYCNCDWLIFFLVIFQIWYLMGKNV